MYFKNIDDAYASVVQSVISLGKLKQNRTGTKAYTIFDVNFKYDMIEGFPILGSKYINFTNVVSELVWFLKGLTNVDFLHIYNNHIWDEWADEDGNLGKIYGYQWRNWGHDQIQNVIDSLILNPDSRRHIVSAWNADELYEMNLPPCHFAHQLYSEVGYDGKRYLSLKWFQRSVDVALGLPYNIASYGLLLEIYCKFTNHIPKSLSFSGTDVHIYENHLDTLVKQLTSYNGEFNERPKLLIDYMDWDNIDDIKVENFELIGNTSGRKFNYKIAV